MMKFSPGTLTHIIPGIIAQEIYPGNLTQEL